MVEAFHDEALSEELVHFSQVCDSCGHDTEASDENELRSQPRHELRHGPTVEGFHSTVGLLVVAVDQESMIDRPKVACVAGIKWQNLILFLGRI